MLQHYRAYGCLVASELELPAVPEAPGNPDVYVRLGRAPEGLPNEQERGVCFAAASREALVSLRNIGRFHVKGGVEILVDAAAGTDLATLQLFVTNLAFGLLLHQRGEIVLHAAAVQDGDGCIAFAGASSAGKSTIAAALQRRGHRVVTDELCALRRQGNGFVVVPGPPRLLVWADALRRLGHDPATLAAARPGLQKFALPLGTAHANEPLPLKAVYVLQPWVRDEIDLVPLAGLRRFEALAGVTYRSEYLRAMELESSHFIQLVSLTNFPVTLVQYPRTWRAMDKLLERVSAATSGNVTPRECAT